VLVRTSAGLTRHVHRYHPFDVVGWDGALYPYALSIHDFEPIVGRRASASAGASDLRGVRFVVCSLSPVRTTSIPTPSRCRITTPTSIAMKCSSILRASFAAVRDQGSASARSRCIHPGSARSGPGSESASPIKTTNELAVMIDTFQPLSLTDGRATSATSTIQGAGGDCHSTDCAPADQRGAFHNRQF